MYHVDITYSAIEDLGKLPVATHSGLLKKVNTILSKTPIPKNKRQKQGFFRLKIRKHTIQYSVKENTVRVLAIQVTNSEA